MGNNPDYIAKNSVFISQEKNEEKNKKNSKKNEL